MLTRPITRCFSTAQTLFKAAKPVSPALLSLKVGHIRQCDKHPDADKLYVSKIEHGEGKEPLTVCSGLVDWVPREEMQGRRVVLLTNLKPAPMRGIVSEAMLLAAEKTSDEGETLKVEGVELVTPPPQAAVGAALEFEGFDAAERGDDGEKLRLSPKAWKKIQKGLFTDDSGVVFFKDSEGEMHRLVVKGTTDPATVPTAFNSVVR